MEGGMIDMSSTDTHADDGRVTRRDLAEGRITKVLDPERTGMVPVRDGGLRFDNAFQMAEAAKLMATAGPLLPEWLQGNVGGCWAIILRSNEIGISPLTLASMTFVTEKAGKQRIGYDSSYFRTLVEMYAPIKERLAARYEGDGDELVCIVSATFKGESAPRQFPPKGTEKEFTLGKLRPERNQYGQIKGSPLWDEKPALQLFYAMSRDWARMYCTDIVAGVYSKEELIESGFEDVTKPTDLSPRLRERLRGPVGEGFEHTKSSIEASIAAASTVDAKMSGRQSAPAGQPADGDAPAEAASSSSSPPSPGDDAATADKAS
ncbi:hypothetical protein I6F35_06535 [Bradyrhizobium sp. BRP22]|uniref:hypothetical protein n=1 Tax=Bradyrhizobium sp. BRP22 TaxID=2793821 RepID=UPI001CD6DB76|nr:hypothetical protein [Bradyrhizobium sp. BRP22]MCA1452878.1 hypothetical protein [Bradyrhizobium sp. BRP22]